MNPAQSILLFALHVYRAAISPLLTGLFGPAGLGCRYTPTCSQYASEAVRRHGAAKGMGLALIRLCRCHPWGGCGCDPVPLGPSESRHQRNSPEGLVPLKRSSGSGVISPAPGSEESHNRHRLLAERERNRECLTLSSAQRRRGPGRGGPSTDAIKVALSPSPSPARDEREGGATTPDPHQFLRREKHGPFLSLSTDSHGRSSLFSHE